MNKLLYALSAMLIAVSIASCTGPQGAVGPLGPQGPLGSCCQERKDGVFPSGGVMPGRLAFDGDHIWVANGFKDEGSLVGSLAKVRIRDGTLLGTYLSGEPLAGYGPVPRRLAFDGANVWVGNLSGKTLAKIRASDGVLLGSYQHPGVVMELVFDGANIWVAFAAPDALIKLQPNDGEIIGTYSFGGVKPQAMAFDGANIWVASVKTDTILADGLLTKIQKSDGAVKGTYFSGGRVPSALAFDGANIWVAHRDIPPPPYSDTNTYFHTVSKIRASDGTFLGLSSSGGYRTVALAFDGANIWVANGESDSVGKIRARDGKFLGTYPSGGVWPDALAFDGASIWVANGHSNTIAAKCVWCCYRKECP
jgi:hypothetical protein